jgi:hypothetical protein
MSSSFGLGVPGVLGGAASAASYERLIGGIGSIDRYQKIVDEKRKEAIAAMSLGSVMTGTARRRSFDTSTSTMRYEVEEWLKDWDK